MGTRTFAVVLAVACCVIVAWRLTAGQPKVLPAENAPRYQLVPEAEPTLLELQRYPVRSGLHQSDTGTSAIESPSAPFGGFEIRGVILNCPHYQTPGAQIRIAWQQYPELGSFDRPTDGVPDLMAPVSQSGEFYLRVSADAWVPYRLYRAEIRGPQGQRLYFGPVPLDPYLLLELDRERVLEGFIEVDGVRAADAKVMARLPPQGGSDIALFLASGKTDDQGKFSLPFRVGEHVEDVQLTIAADRGDPLSATVPLARLTSGTPSVIAFTTWSINITVLDSAGRPGSGAVLSVAGRPTSGGSFFKRYEQHTGRVRLQVQEGVFDLCAYLDQRHTTHCEQIVVGPNGPRSLSREIRLSSRPRSQVVRGEVLDDQARPATDLQVAAIPNVSDLNLGMAAVERVDTDETGSFVLSAPSSPLACLVISYPGEPIQFHKMLVPVGENIRILLPALGTMKVLTRAVITGAPVRPRRLECMLVDRHRDSVRLVSSRGMTIHERVAHGEYNVFVRASGGAYFGQAPCAVNETQPRATVEVDLVPAVCLRGSVTGNGVGGGRIRVAMPAWPPEVVDAWFATTCKPDGSFELQVPDRSGLRATVSISGRAPVVFAVPSPAEYQTLALPRSGP